jgi:hypothetical protein
MRLSDRELQLRLVYSVLVAGKSAAFAERKTVELFVGSTGLPFGHLRMLIAAGILEGTLQQVRTGRYKLLARCLAELVNLDPRTCTIKELEAVPGIGPKTARFFILWTRPDAHCAALDVHVLRYLRSKGYPAPKSTPPAGRRYRKLEQAFLAEADRQGMTARELDLAVWENEGLLEETSDG